MKRYIRLFEEHHEPTMVQVNKLRQLGLIAELDFKLNWSMTAHEWLLDWSQNKDKERESARNWQLADGRYLTNVLLEPPVEYDYRWDNGLVHLKFNDDSTAVLQIVPTSNYTHGKMKDLSIGRTLEFGSYIPHVIDQVEKTDLLLEGILNWFNSEWTKLTKG
jgi:hypothetical protein